MDRYTRSIFEVRKQRDQGQKHRRCSTLIFNGGFSVLAPSTDTFKPCNRQVYTVLEQASILAVRFTLVKGEYENRVSAKGDTPVRGASIYRNTTGDDS